MSIEQILLETSSISQHVQREYTDENAIAKVLLDEAEQLYSRIVDTITNNCIDLMPNDFTESPSNVLQVSDVNGTSPYLEGDNRNILDTRKLSEVNLVYDNITFQLYPGFNITHKGNTETHIRPRENE